MGQMSFAQQAEFQRFAKKSRREQLLEAMEEAGRTLLEQLRHDASPEIRSDARQALTVLDRAQRLLNLSETGSASTDAATRTQITEKAAKDFASNSADSL